MKKVLITGAAGFLGFHLCGTLPPLYLPWERSEPPFQQSPIAIAIGTGEDKYNPNGSGRFLVTWAQMSVLTLAEMKLAKPSKMTLSGWYPPPMACLGDSQFQDIFISIKRFKQFRNWIPKLYGFVL